MTGEYFNEPEVAKFQILLEEVTRARPGTSETRFVPPDAQSLDRLQSRFHHVLYGRRGTGKSSLLRRMEANISKEGHLVAWADQETFVGLSYPDVLVGTLAEVFRQFSTQIRGKVPHPKGGNWWWPFRRLEIPSTLVLASKLDEAVRQLDYLKNSPSESEIAWTATFEDQAASDSSLDTGVSAAKSGFQLKVGHRRSRSSSRSRGGEVASRYVALKQDHLERAVTTYRAVMREVTEHYPDAYIILDDFYRLSESVQPNIAGYFHRVVKDTSVWLKFGSIPFWTRLYAGGTPSVGLQTPHDLREISLDRGLPDFKSSKRFLESILNSLADEVGVDVGQLFTRGALDRLVLGAGGVPRDYIGLVSDSIARAKNRGASRKTGTERVIAEDVNEAAGQTVNQKFADLQEDASDHSSELRDLVIKLTAHCRQTRSACFLADISDGDLVQKLGRLQNMRFVHLIDSNESLPDQQSSRYLVYFLDVSQLAAQRAWNIDFMGWTKREKRRARKLVYREGNSFVPGEYESQDLLEVLADDEAAVVEAVDPPMSSSPVI